MPHTAPDKAAEPAPQREPGFAEWHARAATLALSAHGITGGSIPARFWRHAYVRGLTPKDAVEQAAAEVRNRRSGERLHQWFKHRS